jgi:hypothetical protein
MAFKLACYSQQDPQWKSEVPGFGDPGDTIGYVGYVLTSLSMLLRGCGYGEMPRTLNEERKKADGFTGAGIRWDAVSG